MNIHISTARPMAQIVTRRHPLAFALYALVFLLGIIFVFHWYGTGRTEKLLFPGIAWYVIFAWKWMMVVGGGLALLALTTKPRMSPNWPDIADLLHVEGIGSIVGAFGLLVYIIAIIHLQGLVNAGSAGVVYTALITGLVWRGVQAIREGKMLEDYATELENRGYSNGQH